MSSSNPSHDPIWSLPIEEVYTSLNSAAEGLAETEAVRRFQEFGANELPEPAHRPLWLKFTDQLTHFMALLLWAAGALAFISRTPELGWAIWAVIWINAIFSFWQEFQAEQALSALKKVLPIQVKVYRDRNLRQIPTRELVRGDVIQIEEGDLISADVRLISAESLSLDVSVMTGESLPVTRTAQALNMQAHPTDLSNLVLAGSTVAAGRGQAIVYATGAQTEFGQVAYLTTGVKRDPSTLEVEIERIVRVLTAIAVTMGFLVFLLAYFWVGIEIKESFIFAIGIIVALVPEGLLPTVTLSLAIGVRQMAKQNALVRRLSAVETLSAMTVICTDKTGTLTKNEMTVRYLWLSQETEKLIELTGAGYDPTIGTVNVSSDPIAAWKTNLLLVGSALCSNAHLSHLTTPERWCAIGDPTEAALLVALAKSGLQLDTLQQQLPRLRELPFDSTRRMMTVVVDWRSSEIWPGGAGFVAFTKGSPLDVLKQCNCILHDGTVENLSQDAFDRVVKANDELAMQGFRVLGLAARKGEQELLDLKIHDLEQQLIFIGLVAMFDPPCPEVKNAIVACHKAGIKVTMVTGDYGLTAGAIAQNIGLIEGDDRVRVITGEEMKHLSDAQLQQTVKYRTGLVFARMSPENKLRLVQAYKDVGEVVAVTGDGVNDAPALRAAHIGIAMGMNGTDVAREAADIVLTDDNFATIVLAIEQGRSVYQNIRKFMTYILTSNIPELVPFLAMVILKVPPALVIMQILIIDLGTDILPALALGTELAEAGTMNLPPRSRSKPLLDRTLLLRAYGFLGVIEAGLAMVGFLWVWQSYGYDLTRLQSIAPAILSRTADSTVMLIYAQATTMTLAIIVACQTGNVFACRSERSSIFRFDFFSNSFIWLGIAIEWMLIVSIIEIPPLQKIFSASPLTVHQWFLLALCPFILLGIEELRKAFLRQSDRCRKSQRI
jgi:potassium/sodium efflux P-type ATPase